MLDQNDRSSKHLEIVGMVNEMVSEHLACLRLKHKESTVWPWLAVILEHKLISALSALSANGIKINKDSI